MAADLLQRLTAEQALQHESLSGASLSDAEDMRRLLPNYAPCIDLPPVVSLGQAGSLRAGLQRSHDSGALHSAANAQQGSVVQIMYVTTPLHFAGSTQAVLHTDSNSTGPSLLVSILSGASVSI